MGSVQARSPGERLGYCWSKCVYVWGGYFCLRVLFCGQDFPLSEPSSEDSGKGVS